MTHLANIDKDYAFWIERLSQRYKQSQIKAATHVNSEMLQFYWSLGRDIVMLHAESRWGDKFVKTFASFNLFSQIRGSSHLLHLILSFPCCCPNMLIEIIF